MSGTSTAKTLQLNKKMALIFYHDIILIYNWIGDMSPRQSFITILINCTRWMFSLSRLKSLLRSLKLLCWHKKVLSGKFICRYTVCCVEMTFCPILFPMSTNHIVDVCITAYNIHL